MLLPGQGEGPDNNINAGYATECPVSRPSVILDE